MHDGPGKAAILGQLVITGFASGPVATTTCAAVRLPAPRSSLHPAPAWAIRATAALSRIRIPAAYRSR
jgi:hypothetical protein